MTKEDIYEMIKDKGEVVNCSIPFPFPFEKIIKDFGREEIYFKNVSFDKEVLISGLNLSTIIFEECNFKEGIVRFDRVEIFYEIIFDRCILNKGVDFYHLKNNKLIIRDSQIEFINLIDSCINESFSLDLVSISQLLNIEKSSIFYFELIDSSIREVFIKNTAIENELKVQKSFISKLKLVGDDEEKLVSKNDKKDQDPYQVNKIVFKELASDFLVIKKCSLKEVVFFDTFFKGDSNVLFYEVKLGRILFELVINKGCIRLISLEPKKCHEEKMPLMKVKDSLMGELVFSKCDFENFSAIRIINSDVSQVTFIGSKPFPVEKIFVVEEDDIKEAIVEGLERKILFGQLKKAALAKSDQINYMLFYAEEMKAYAKSLSWINNFPERFLLFLNRMSNDYNKSWLRGFFVTIFCSFLFFIFYCFAHSEYSFEKKLAIVCDNLYLFLEFMFPAHSWQFMAALLGPPGTYAYIVDALARVFISYCIYQTISAFRKYGKI